MRAAPGLTLGLASAIATSPLRGYVANALSLPLVEYVNLYLKVIFLEGQNVQGSSMPCPFWPCHTRSTQRFCSGTSVNSPSCQRPS